MNGPGEGLLKKGGNLGNYTDRISVLQPRNKPFSYSINILTKEVQALSDIKRGTKLINQAQKAGVSSSILIEHVFEDLGKSIGLFNN